MSDNSSNNKRIAKNTVVLYFRMFLTIALQLYTVPVVLRVLGSENYGLYNVIGGITALFSFVGGSLASGSQRFFSYAIGKGEQDSLNSCFRTTLNIYLSVAIASFVLFEILGTWFINTKMQIPEGSEFAANYVFQFSIIAFIVSLITVPYNAVVIAHERMGIYAYVCIASSLLKLLVVILLQFASFNLLIGYAFLLMLIQVSESLFYQLYCRRFFEECRKWKWGFDKVIVRNLLTYSGFNVIGTFAMILRKQGLNIVMNLFFGTLLNAAHALGTQINGVIEQFVNNLYMASRPQITKYYASGQLKEMWSLVFRTSLFAYYLIMVMAIIAIIEMPTVLEFWLKDVPEYTVNIARLFIICLMIETTTNQLISVFQAENKVKYYQIFSSTILLLNVPVAYMLLKIDSSNALLPYYVQVAFSTIYVLSIIIVSTIVTKLTFIDYLKNVLIREIIVTSIVVVLVFTVTDMITPSLLRVLLTISLTLVLSTIIIITIGVDREDRIYLLNIVKTRILSKTNN